MTTYDVVLYDGEADLLQLRASVLAEVVDVFVVVMANRTHQGDPTDAEAIDPVLAVVHAMSGHSAHGHLVDLAHLDGEPGGGAGRPGYQVRERVHRNGMLAALNLAGVEPGDLVLMSDVDEIPDPEAVRAAQEPGASFAYVCAQEMRVWSLRWRFPGPWLGTIIARWPDVDEGLGGRAWTPQGLRDLRGTMSLDTLPTDLGSGGWHLSWFGDDWRRRRKLASFSHGELAHLDDDLARRADEGIDVNGVTLTDLGDRWADGLHPAIVEAFT